MSKAITVKISGIDLESSPQVREGIDQPTVERYSDLIRDGIQLHPVLLVRLTSGGYLVVDGHHRIRGAVAAGLDSVQAEVFDGTREDAVWLGAQANCTHGLPLTREGKRRAVAAILSHPRSEGMSDREIARLTATSHPFVAKLRQSIAVESGEFFKPGFVYTCKDAAGEIFMVRDRSDDPGFDPERRDPFCQVAWTKGVGTNVGVWVYFKNTFPLHRRLVTSVMRDCGFEKTTEWEIQPPSEAPQFYRNNDCEDPARLADAVRRLGPPGEMSSDLHMQIFDALIDEAANCKKSGNVTSAGGAA